MKPRYSMCLTTSIALAGPLFACSPESAESLSIGAVHQEVQIDFADAWNVILGSDTLDLRARATGALQDKHPPGFPNWSCGLTFVSPHFGVTASHCLEDYTNITDSIPAKQYNTYDLSQSDVVAQSVVTGSWGQWSRDSVLTSTMGYEVSNYDCRIVSNCGSEGVGEYNCPLSGTTDIAMIRCDDRHDMAYYVGAMDMQESGEEVDVYWCHEVLDLPTTDDSSEYWDHYGFLDTANRDENWHYSDDAGYPSSEHQLLPIHSDTFPDGTQYEALGRSGSEFSVDAPGCFGTSGSGVFIGNRLVGVVASSGVDSLIGSQLCDAMDAAQPGEDRLRAVHSTITYDFSEILEVQEDRALVAFVGAVL